MIQISNVSKSLREKQILKDIDIEVPKGSIFGLIGANGAGKTTLIKSLVGIYQVDQGEILIEGQRVFDNSDCKQRIGYVADENHFYPSFQVKQLITFYEKAYSNFSTERFNRLNEIFKIPVNKRIRQLSKGMKMRVALMLNLSIYPDVLILDEPTSGLDAIAKKQIMNILMEEVAERQTTIFISSHHLHDLERICDHVGILDGGVLKYYNSIEEMKKNIKKLQVVFEDEASVELDSWVEFMNVEKIGRVHYGVTKHYTTRLKEKLLHMGALFVEEINLSLEDMFIYSLGEGSQYESLFK